MFGGYLWMYFVFMAILAFLYIFVGAICEEAAANISRWWEGRRGLTDRRQSRSVRLCAQRLTSPRKFMRYEAAELLGELGDRSAVPALLRALDCYPEDIPFLLRIVHSLERLGDARALPALHRLTTNRHYRLMGAASEAIAAIEPQAVLLRSTSQPAYNREELLQPAHGVVASEASVLLRSGSEK